MQEVGNCSHSCKNQGRLQASGLLVDNIDQQPLEAKMGCLAETQLQLLPALWGVEGAATVPTQRTHQGRSKAHSFLVVMMHVFLCSCRRTLSGTLSGHVHHHVTRFGLGLSNKTSSTGLG